MRALIELATMAVVMALVLKGFLLDAYKIPTGSMQPTLVGDERAGISDRILVDRVSWALREPRRFEVAVFRYPLDRSKTYVKRIVGIGPEEITLRGGDVFRRADPSEPWTIARRPPAVREAAWLALDRAEPAGPSWSVATAGQRWSVSGRDVEARGDGRAQFVHERGSIRDWYLDGYPESLRERIRPRAGSWGRHPVGDLRLDASVTALSGARRVTLELFEGPRRYAFRLPGPAADEAARPAIEVSDQLARSGAVSAEDPWRLPAGRAVRVRAQNQDDRLELRIEGRPPLSLDVEPVLEQTSAVFVAVEGEGALLRDLMPYRDVYYTSDESKRQQYSVPAGHYFMLGDNSQDSSDSRDWTLWRVEVEPGGELFAEPEAEGPRVLRGEARRGENPRTVNAAELPGPTTFLVDEWGEPHWIDPERSRSLPPEHVPFVARDAILGRAFAVFWPIDPRRDLNRLAFVR